MEKTRLNLLRIAEMERQKKSSEAGPTAIVKDKEAPTLIPTMIVGDTQEPNSRRIPQPKYENEMLTDKGINWPANNNKKYRGNQSYQNNQRGFNGGGQRKNYRNRSYEA